MTTSAIHHTSASRWMPLWLAALWLLSAWALAAQPTNLPVVTTIRLLTQATVDSQGVFLDQLVEDGAENPALHLRVAPAPASWPASWPRKAARPRRWTSGA